MLRNTNNLVMHRKKAFLLKAFRMTYNGVVDPCARVLLLQSIRQNLHHAPRHIAFLMTFLTQPHCYEKGNIKLAKHFKLGAPKQIE